MSDKQPDVWGPPQPGNLSGFQALLAAIIVRILQEEAEEQGAVQYSPGQATGEEGIVSEEPQSVEETAPGDWWLLAGALRLAVELEFRRRWSHIAVERFHFDRGMEIDDFHYDVLIDIPGQSRQVLGRVIFTEKRGRAAMQAITPGHLVDFWTAVLVELRGITESARFIRRSTLGHTPDEVIAHYYRVKAQGTKITLKQLAESAGLNYGYLREKKQEYDRAGKWGSKAHKQSTDKNTDKI